MIADAHTHIYPDPLAARALRQIVSFYNFEDRENQDGRMGTVGKLLEIDSACGISISLVCEAAHKPGLVGKLNDFIEQSVRESQGRLLGLCAVHPDCADAAEILADAKKRGFSGVKLHPEYQDFVVDDPKCDPIYDFCCQEHFYLLMHCGDDRYDHSSPERLARVLRRFPDLPLIAAHFGGYRRWNESINLPKAKNLYFDTSSSLFLLPGNQAAAFFEKFGWERFLFGSDYPLFHPEEELRRFQSLGLPEERQQQLLFGNFAQLFGLSVKEGKIFQGPSVQDFILP